MDKMIKLIQTGFKRGRELRRTSYAGETVKFNWIYADADADADVDAGANADADADA